MLGSIFCKFFEVRFNDILLVVIPKVIFNYIDNKLHLNLYMKRKKYDLHIITHINKIFSVYRTRAGIPPVFLT